MAIQRVTRTLLLVIGALLDEPDVDHYGYSVAQATGLAGGTVQPILTRLEGEGWLTSRWEDIDPHVEGRRPRRLYQFTPDGERAAADLYERRREHAETPAMNWGGASA